MHIYKLVNMVMYTYTYIYIFTYCIAIYKKKKYISQDSNSVTTSIALNNLQYFTNNII